MEQALPALHALYSETDPTTKKKLAWPRFVGFTWRVKETYGDKFSGISGTPKDMVPLGPHKYYFHTTPIRILKDMAIVWEAYHKGVPLFGVLGITLDKSVLSRTSKLW